jgi:hypothetical protein
VLTAALATRRARADKLGFDALQISGQFPSSWIARLLHLLGNTQGRITAR